MCNILTPSVPGTAERRRGLCWRAGAGNCHRGTVTVFVLRAQPEPGVPGSTLVTPIFPPSLFNPHLIFIIIPALWMGTRAQRGHANGPNHTAGKCQSWQENPGSPNKPTARRPLSFDWEPPQWAVFTAVTTHSVRRSCTPRAPSHDPGCTPLLPARASSPEFNRRGTQQRLKQGQPALARHSPMFCQEGSFWGFDLGPWEDTAPCCREAPER